MKVELRHIGKRYAGVHALSDVTLTIEPGTIHALVGENGAGKSTLAKILAGVIPRDTGEVQIDGAAVEFRNPRDALHRGITIIGQELSLEPARTISENVLLGMESARLGWLNRRTLNERCRALADSMGFHDLARRVQDTVATLRVADQQKVEILRAMARNAKLIVMDEPTAALPADAAETLLADVLRFRDGGTTILYISHHLEEVLSIADDVTVLRNGQLINSGPARSETPESLVLNMLGRSGDLTFPDKVFPARGAPLILAAEGLTRDGAFTDVDIDIRAGEIVGLAGLVGSGRTEIARAIFGADRLDRGVIHLVGEEVSFRSPMDAIRIGIAMLPESRKEQGLLLSHSVKRNITLPFLRELSRAGFVESGREAREAREIADSVDVRSAGLDASVSSLSGGNQQKVLFAKWLFRVPRLLIVDEPTRGVDVGAKRAIYELIASLAFKGMAVILISSELKEVVGLAHRVMVVRDGRAVAEFVGEEINEEDVLLAAFAAEADLEKEEV